jgi:hypothetical protein
MIAQASQYIIEKPFRIDPVIKLQPELSADSQPLISPGAIIKKADSISSSQGK